MGRATTAAAALLVALNAGGNTAPNPHRVALACAQDTARLCPTEQGRMARACLTQHHVSLSLACRQALAQPRTLASP
jgi:hypothetical protein